MHESVLKDFFLGQASVQTLKEDLVGAVTQDSPFSTSQHIVNAPGEFQVTTAHLIRVCDAVLDGGLPAADLEIIGFCLVSSDYFVWDGDDTDGSRVAETAFDWSAPEVNFQLSLETASKFKERLMSGVDTFTSEDAKR